MSKSNGKIEINTKRCKGCGLCIPACPNECISLSKQADLRGICVAVFNARQDCTGCTYCAILCPDVAINVYKKIVN